MVELVRDGGVHEGAVLHAEQAVQCGLKALLHGLGETRRARGHDLVGLADACEELAGLVLGGDTREALGELAASYMPSRYPDALPGGTPADHYGPRAADEALRTARAVLGAVEHRKVELADEEAPPSGQAPDDGAGEQ